MDRALATAIAVLSFLAVLAFLAVGCTETFDAGSSPPHGLLPVDERNPIVLVNDGAYDNWQGEYAVLLANGGGPKLAGIVVDASTAWPDLQTNVIGWRNLVAAARMSGLQDLPDPRESIGPPLVRPASGNIKDTVANRSEGALFIVEESKKLSLPYRPLVIATGGLLTDVADAYLVDNSVTERVVVVSSLGGVTASGGNMSIPNGDGDPWADTIVAEQFRYVQVSAWYDQITMDVPTSSVPQLPANPLGAWMAAKQPNLWQWSPASDQVAVLAVGLPSFATAVANVTAGSPVPAGATAGPDLVTASSDSGWLVTACAGSAASERLWQLLLDPTTFAH